MRSTLQPLPSALWSTAAGLGFVLVAASSLPSQQAGNFVRQPADKSAPAALPSAPPAPKDNPTTADKVALGRQLFFDPRLSGDNTMSCATCHVPEKAFGDGRAKAQGAGGKELSRNTPSLVNVGYYSTYFWDGRVGSLEEQALMPIRAADEMNQDLDELERELNAVPGYVRQFRAVFGTAVTRDGIAKALAAFQRTLVAGPSPYDRYLAGDKKALSEEAKRGMDVFFGVGGCVRCHSGPLLSDEKFHRLGISHDRGRGAVTGRKDDDYRMRTPSLRNVGYTGPYMHDGSRRTLPDVVLHYYRNAPAAGPEGSPVDIEALAANSFSDIPDLVAFLESLSGELPKVTPPKLP